MKLKEIRRLPKHRQTLSTTSLTDGGIRDDDDILVVLRYFPWLFRELGRNPYALCAVLWASIPFVMSAIYVTARVL